MTQPKQLTAIVQGYVQGVSFRYYTQRAAYRLGVKGWVANRRNGTVKVVAQGNEAALQEFLTFLHEGSPAAAVQRVDVVWQEVTEPFTTFTIRLRDA